MTLLRKELDAGALRQRVIANNIANVNIPRFKRSVVRFEESLQEALGKDTLPLLTTDPRHIGGAKPPDELRPEVERDEGTTMRADGNNVDIDQEMALLAANTIMYNAAAQELNERLALLSYVITGRR